GSGTETFSTRCVTPSWHRTGSKTFGDRRFVAIGVTSAAGAAAPRTRPVRTFQVYPKDLRVLPGHAEPAVSWHSGFRGGAHARPKTTAVHHAAGRRGSRVAATRQAGFDPIRTSARSIQNDPGLPQGPAGASGAS